MSVSLHSLVYTWYQDSIANVERTVHPDTQKSLALLTYIRGKKAHSKYNQGSKGGFQWQQPQSLLRRFFSK